MPATKIFITTFMCSQCRFHRAVDNLTPDGLCPVHQVPLEKTSAENDKISVTIMAEEDVDTLVKHGEQLVQVAVADELDSAEVAKATEEARTPDIKTRVDLPQTEKDAMKDKIRQDIITFSALEDK